MLETFGELQKLLIPVFVFFKDWIFPVIKTWWWVLPPFLLIKPALFLWLWWRQELNFKDRKYVLLEIKLPEETLKPIKAMEDVFSTFYMTARDQEPANFREKWIEGMTSFFPSLSLEIASFGGETHFFIRTETAYRDWVQSAIYSQYPDIEILEVEDYTQFVPQDIPNEKWNLEARDWVLKKEDCYPVKTYDKFETGREPKEEKRVDPMAKLLEALSALKEGEQVWIQILLNAPKANKPGIDWIKEGEKIRDKLAKRPKSTKPKPMIQEAAEILIKGPPKKKEEEEKEIIPPEMKLTPGEREIVKEVEKKISKSGFGAVIRTIYLATSDVFFKPNFGLPVSFVLNFNTGNLNRFNYLSQTTTKVKSIFWFWDKRRAFLKKRKMFKRYIMRLTPLFPQKGGTCVLNAEELASIFHFPGRIVAPAPFVPRVEAKKGEAPPGLPVE